MCYCVLDNPQHQVNFGTRIYRPIKKMQVEPSVKKAKLIKIQISRIVNSNQLTTIRMQCDLQISILYNG